MAEKGIDYSKHQQGGKKKSRKKTVAGLCYEEEKKNAKAKGKKSRK